MTVFKDTQHMYAVLEDLWNFVIRETECGQKMKEYDVSYKFLIKEPNGTLYVDHEKVLIGDEANRDAVITMELSGETVHKFWLKQIQLPVALATRKIKSKGPIPKVLKMLPYLKPVYENYPRFCEKHGIEIVDG
jgi:putative sterol carrier protein